MNIAFLTLEYPPRGGGIASSLGTLCPALVELGHSVRAVGWANRAQQAVVDGVLVDLRARTRVPKLGWWMNPRRVAQSLRRLPLHERPDIVVAHDWCAPSSGFAAPCPVVIWCHGSATYFAHLTGEPVRPRVARAERRALADALAVAAVSSYTATLTQELFGLHQCPATLPNAVDVQRFAPRATELVRSKDLLYSGTLVRKKGVLDLCRAFNRVAHHDPEARLVLAGRDSRDALSDSPSTWELCLQELDERARARTEYLGFVPHAEIERLTATCQAAVLPSRAEALPLAWMEVMACGRPVVGFDQGWARELVRDGVEGRLVEDDEQALADAMLDVLREPERAHAMGAAARQTMCREFAPDVVASRFVEWLEQSLAKPRVRQ